MADVSSAPLISGSQQELLDTLTKRLGGGGAPWLETSPEQLVSRWQKYIAQPMMGAWEQTVKPLAMRKYNLPGSFYSADRARGMTREAESFFQQNLLPSLYSSQENMFNRLFSLASGLSLGQTQENIAEYDLEDYLKAGIGGGLGGGLGGMIAGLF